MAWSKLDIVNLALGKLNKGSVNDLSNSGVFADSASRTFDLLLPSELSGYSWRFATKTQTLSKTLNTPLLDIWSHEFALPADYLAAVRTRPAVPFQIYEDKIWANATDLDLEYRFQVDPTRLPAYFVHYFAVMIASWFADTVANDPRLSQKLEQEAMLLKDKALFTDSQSHPTPAIRHNPVIDSRGNFSTNETSHLVKDN